MIHKESFGTCKGGEAVFVYTIENKNGVKARITNYGATWVSMIVPDKNGTMTDVLLGYDNVTGYESNGGHFGGLIGRNSNRIAGAKVTINGVTYELDPNNNENNLHSGNHCVDKVIWDVKEHTRQALTLTYRSADMEQGFPGNMDMEVSYVLTDDNALEIHYQASADKDTVANFTNHAYFNLAGHASGDVLGQELMLKASHFTPVIDAKAIPTGETVPVAGTPMDFTAAKPIGRDINADDSQLVYGNGYDHNFMLDKSEKGAFALMAEAYAPDTGIVMEAYTDCPAVQFYTGNAITPRDGKQGAAYAKRHGFCLESQFAPNAVNDPHFEAPFLKAGEVYTSKTSYRFDVR